MTVHSCSGPLLCPSAARQAMLGTERLYGFACWTMVYMSEMGDCAKQLDRFDEVVSCSSALSSVSRAIHPAASSRATHHWGALPAALVHALGLCPQGQRAPPLGAAHPPHNPVQHLHSKGHKAYAGSNLTMNLLPSLCSRFVVVPMVRCNTAHIDPAPASQGKAHRNSSST